MAKIRLPVKLSPANMPVRRASGFAARAALGSHPQSAAQQQGLMQIVRDFCEHSNAICADYRFPELIRGWGGAGIKI
jgi:hypothetical protein